MRILLYINGKKIRFWANVGWYVGEPFVLIGLSLFEIDIDIISILHFQIAKFVIAAGFDTIDEAS